MNVCGLLWYIKVSCVFNLDHYWQESCYWAEIPFKVIQNSILKLDFIESPVTHLNVYATPHIGSLQIFSLRKKEDICGTNVLDILKYQVIKIKGSYGHDLNVMRMGIDISSQIQYVISWENVCKNCISYSKKYWNNFHTQNSKKI